MQDRDTIIDIGPTRYRFELGEGRSIRVEPVEALAEIQAILGRLKDAEPTPFQHTREFRDWLQAQHPEAGSFSLSEADAIWDAIQERYTRGKAELGRRLNSFTSTVPTSSDSTLTPDSDCTGIFDESEL